MQPTLKFDRTLVTVLLDEVVHVLLELTAPPAVAVQRAPLDVVVVLDRSGSMSGAPLDSVTAATAQLLRLAGPDDRLAVVAFDDEVQLVLPLAHHEPDAASRAVRAIGPGGSTNLSGGWMKGLELLTTAPRPEALRRVIVLTDGHA
ncbi:MAG: VWA domain-containing protein, partial [Ilumatobacteraceae bacterium]